MDWVHSKFSLIRNGNDCSIPLSKCDNFYYGKGTLQNASRCGVKHLGFQCNSHSNDESTTNAVWLSLVLLGL